MGKRGKPSVNVNRALLENTIQALEAAQTFENRSKLFDAVAAAYNKASAVQVTPPLIYLRVKAWDIQLKTPKGKPGRVGGNPTIGTAPRVSREVKFSKNESIQESFTELKKVTKPKYHKLVKRAAAGSLKAAIKLKCLDCSCGDTKDIKCCPVVSCSLWAFRPFQGRTVTNSEEVKNGE